MERILLCVAAFSAAISCVSAVNCTTLPNGNYEAGCKSYATCTGGVGAIVDCPEHMVYNNNTAMCDDETKVPPPCGVLIDCTAKADGRYPDMDQNCRTWYTCQDKKFLGHNFCPVGTVFDTKLNTCNWENAVPPPCGTWSG